MDKRGKRILPELIILVILISFFSIFVLAIPLTENNTKNYDEETKTVTIENNNIEIAKIKLNTPLVHKVIRGKDRLVAEFTINNYKDYSNAFKKLEFYNIKNNMKKFERKFTYKYKKSFGFETINDYETICVDKKQLTNGTILKECHQELTGTHQEERFEWVEFDSKQELPEGKITIGLFTDVQPNEKIEWIPTLFGVKINEWAEWSESMSVNLDFYYKFDETEGSVVSDFQGNYTGTAVNMEDGDWIPGKIGNAIRFGGTDEYINTTMKVYYSATDDFAYNFWFNDSAWEAGQNVHTFGVRCDMAGINGVVNPLRELGTDLPSAFVEGADGTQLINGSTDVANNSWHMITFVRNTSEGKLLFYIDNVNVANETENVGIINTTHFRFTLGVENYDGTPRYYMTHDLDEMGVWSRALSVSEIDSLWNDGDGITISSPVAPNTSTPTIKPLAPITSNNLECNATLTDNSETNLIAYWTWYKNNILNLSGIKTGITNNTNTIITTLLSGNTTKNDNWTCEVLPFDGYNNGTAKNSSSTMILNTAPYTPIQLEPENASRYPMNSTITFIWNNSEDVDTDTITYNLEIYNESDMATANLIHSNTSITESVSNTSITIKLSDHTITNDDYYWRIKANDSENVSNWSENWTFQYANWTITFNLTDEDTGEQIDTSMPQDDFDISCNNGFNGTDVENLHNGVFASGIWECNFSSLSVGTLKYLSETQSFTANNNKTIVVPMSRSGGLTLEEHTWLEWLYTCWNSGSCKDLLENINETTTDIWQRLTGTNTDVITDETVVSYVLNSTSNITINYTIDVPYKSEVAVNELLPIRMYFWFTDVGRTACYSQDKVTDTNRAEDNYCLPLVAEVLGPNNGTVSFQVNLRPNLSNGTYNFTRSIEIDPVGVWTQYGREDIGQIEVLETGDASIDVSDKNLINSPTESSNTASDSSISSGSDKESSVTNVYNTYITEESDDEEVDDEVINLNKPGITGGIIGTNLLSNWMFIIILGIFAGLFIVIVIYKKILRIKKIK